MNILISSAGKRVSLVRIFKEEAQKLIPGCKIYTTDLDPVLAPACHVSDKSFKVRKITQKGAIEELLDICIANKVSLVIPTIDTELLVLASNKEKFASHGITLVISSKAFITICRDKRLTNNFFTENSINIPAPVSRTSPTFPFFAKPYDGSLSKDIYLVKSSLDLTEEILQNDKLMFMQYLNPKQYTEFTVDMYYGQDNCLKCVVPRERIEVRAGEINKGVTRKNRIVPYLQKQLQHLEGAVGCLTVQFFLSNSSKEIIGIEINPRFGGGFPLTYRSGANYPQYIIKEYMQGKQLSYFDDWQENLLMLRYDDEILIADYNE